MGRSALLTRDEATGQLAEVGLALVGVLSGRSARTVRVLLEGRVTRASLSPPEYREVTRWRWAVGACVAAGHGDVVAGEVEGLVSLAEHDREHRAPAAKRRQRVERRCVA